MNYLNIMYNYLASSNFTNIKKRVDFSNTFQDKRFDKQILLDFTKPELEIPADLIGEILDRPGDYYNHKFVYPILFEHKYIKKVKLGNSIIWSALDKARDYYSYSALRERCLVMDLGENKYMFASPGMLSDSNDVGLYRFVVRMKRNEEECRYTPTNIVMYVNPNVFTQDTSVNNSIVKTMIPTFLSCETPYWYYRNNVPRTVEIKEFDSFSYTRVPKPVNLNTYENELNECLINFINVTSDI